MDNLWSVTAAGIDVRELPPFAVDMVRLRKPSLATVAAVGESLGVVLPIEPNRAAGDSTRAVWAGPDEWMVVEARGTAQAVDAASGETVSLVVSVGNGRYAVDFSGSACRDLLAKAVSIDLHQRVFAVDATAMTLFAQVPVVIDHIAADTFRLWFDVSLRNYVRTWIADAMIEFSPA